MKMETDPVSEMLCCLVIYKSGRYTKFSNPVILKTEQAQVTYMAIPGTK
jgi:hypothetical protein